MTTDDIIAELDGIARRHPDESGLIAHLSTELRHRKVETLQVEKALHDAIKHIESQGAERGKL